RHRRRCVGRHPAPRRETMALRMEGHQENALRIATWLASHPLVERVYHPGLESHPGYALQKRQASGNTGIFSFKLKDARLVEPVLRHVRLIAFAESLGGVESLMTYPSVQTHADIPEEMRRRVGVDERLLRFSVGIEHVDDLISDLWQAFDAALKEVHAP
ncbi:MAG TPA: PLP-dependent transferase, partial [Archangium sp.]